MGAFLLECFERGVDELDGVEPNSMWRFIAWGVLCEAIGLENFNDKGKEYPQINADFSGFPDGWYDLVLLLSITHVAEGMTGQEILDIAWGKVADGGLLIVEINDRLQKKPIKLPEGAIEYGKNKDNRTVWHCRKD